MVYQCKGGIKSRWTIIGIRSKNGRTKHGSSNPGADKTSYNTNVIEGLLEPYLNSIPNYSFGDMPLESPSPLCGGGRCTLRRTVSP